MATLEQAMNQMRASGMPEMPRGHPIIDGKAHRYARKGRAWYALQPHACGGLTLFQGIFGISGKLAESWITPIFGQNGIEGEAWADAEARMEATAPLLLNEATAVLAAMIADEERAAIEQKKKHQPPDRDLQAQLRERFTWIYPTESAYDHELGDIVGIGPMRLNFGKQPVDTWLLSASRKNVNLEDVVFDPTGEAEAPKVNLYRGLAIEPSKQGSCTRLIELLAFLCGDDVNVFEWVLKWLALPLQKPGAKMQTAIVMRGKEGAGKNLFFGAIRDIYGKHAGVITQRELEDKFNLWLSAKLFLVANEVVTRQEIGHQRGFIKHLITEPEIWINRKMKDARVERNHMNIVFFSNEAQPLQIGPDDRRMVVIDTPAKRDKKFYRAILAELREENGAAALHQYLREIELGEFDESAEPIETEAKRRLVQIGMNAPQLFWQDIYDKEIPLPYCPALDEHVYRAFCAWCKRNGERMPARINRFIPDFMSLNGVRRSRPRVPGLSRQEGVWYANEKKSAQRRVLLMGDQPEGWTIESWVAEGVVEFANAAEKYCRAAEHQWSSDER